LAAAGKAVEASPRVAASSADSNSSAFRALMVVTLIVLASSGPSPGGPGWGTAASSCSDQSSKSSGESEQAVTAFGAKGDGQTPDTAAIQAAVDALHPGDTLRFAPGTYLIEADRGIRLKDDIKLDLRDAVLMAPNVAGARCRVFEIQGHRNIVISGGTIVGSRTTTPEWGVGILASDAEDLTIENVTLREFNHDGILLTGNQGCRRVVIRGCVSDNNRRTALAIVHASEVTVEQSTFSGTRGQSPESGVNCEPNNGEDVRNVTFTGCTFRNNAHAGFYAHRALGVAVAGVTVKDSVVEDNNFGIILDKVEGVTITGNRVSRHKGKGTSGIIVADSTAAVVTTNTLEENVRGIFGASATGIEIRGNTVVGTGPAGAAGAGNGQDGIVCLGLHGPLANACVVADNTIRRTGGSGIVAQTVSTIKITGNTVADAGQRSIYLDSSSNVEARANVISGSGQEAPARYDGIELARSSNSNLITGNTIHLSAGMRNPIGVGPGCIGNRVLDNIVLP
jgi:nitrous oxidase accessory protein NosD